MPGVIAQYLMGRCMKLIDASDEGGVVIWRWCLLKLKIGSFMLEPEDYSIYARMSMLMCYDILSK